MTRPNRIPLFPLVAVLLPGMKLPLHIFESRYKVMIERCLNERLEFGMILATTKSTATVGCTAEIIRRIKDYPDGRMDILVEGRAVFQLVEVLHEKDYYEGAVEYLPDDPTPQAPEKESQLTELFQQCHALLFGHAWAGSDRRDATTLSYHIAARLPLELVERQELLEMREEAKRRDFLLHWMIKVLPVLVHRNRVRQTVGDNGQGLN